MILSGYFAHKDDKWQPWFHQLWWRQNIEPLVECQPQMVYIIASGTSPEPSPKHGTWLALDGDLGHCDEMLNHGRDLFCPACPSTWIAGAWVAYANECDALFIEQDCLCFGNWLERMYADLGGKKVISGSGAMHKLSSTSLFLVRHNFIPQWTREYLEEGPETTYERLPERKMFRMRQRSPENYAQLSFAYDTDRPINPTDATLYAQKLTPDELKALADAGRISIDGMPDVKLFSNHP